jgi:hypothetical protein
VAASNDTREFSMFSGTHPAMTLRRTMAWTHWMPFGTPPSSEKPCRKMQSLVLQTSSDKALCKLEQHNTTCLLNLDPTLIQCWSNLAKEWKIGLELRSNTVPHLLASRSSWGALCKHVLHCAWLQGMQWVLKATFYSDSSVDRTIGFAGPDGGPAHSKQRA